MKLNIFEKVKQSVSAESAASFYGVKTGRSGMTNCLFHSDRTPSMKIYPDHYYCFGCGAHGDVIALTAQLLGLSQLDAAKKLAEDFHIDITVHHFGTRTTDNRPDEVLNIGTQIADNLGVGSSPILSEEETPNSADLRRQISQAVRTLSDYKRIVEYHLSRAAPSTPDEPWSNPFDAICNERTRVVILLDLLCSDDDSCRISALRDHHDEINEMKRITEAFYRHMSPEEKNNILFRSFKENNGGNHI